MVHQVNKYCREESFKKVMIDRSLNRCENLWGKQRMCSKVRNQKASNYFKDFETWIVIRI